MLSAEVNRITVQPWNDIRGIFQLIINFDIFIFSFVHMTKAVVAAYVFLQ